MDPSAGVTADIQTARQGCVGLGHQVEGLAELMVPLLRQATQELHRLETQRDELRKTATREVPQALLPKLLERIEEQSQNVKRLERASRGLKELVSGLGALGEQLQQGLTRQDAEQREREAIMLEEKRLWLRELNTLREQLASPAAAPAGAQLEELQRLRAESEVLPKLRAERDRLTGRVAELDKHLATREQTLAAKEQTIADLRRMILLLSGDKDTTSGPEPTSTPPPTPEPPPVAVAMPLAAPPATPVAITMMAPKATSKTRVPVVEKPAPRAAEQMFGNSTMQLAHSMLETLGEETPAQSLPTLRPTTLAPVMPERKSLSMEVMLGPLDELESVPRPLTPPPVPIPPPVPMMAPVVAPVAARPAMPRASARVEASPPPPAPRADAAPRPPAAAPPAAHRPPVARPGTLVISEDMFNEMLVEDNPLGTPDKK